MSTARNLIRQTITNNPGTSGDIMAGPAVAQWLALVAGDDGLPFDLKIEQPGVGKEVRTGCVYTHATTSLTRGTLVSSTAGVGVAINLTSAAVFEVVLEASRAAALSVVVSSSGVPGARLKPAATASLFAFGDSLTEGQGMSVPANTRYSKLVANAKGLTEVNLAQGGTAAGRWVNDRIASRAFNAGDQMLILPGFNDARWGGATPNNLAQYESNLLGTLAWLGVPDASKVYTQIDSSTPNPALTNSGGWTLGVTWAGQQAQSRCGIYGNSSGQWIEGTVTGDVVHIMLGGYSGFASACQITIDGVSMGAGSINPQPLIGIPDGQTEPWQPYCVRVTGLSNGPHVVRVTLTSNANLLVGYLAGYDSSVNTRPMVYVGSAPRMTAAGYAVAPANATNAIMRQYQDATRRAVDTLAAEGLLIRYVDIDSVWTPSAGGLNADSVHPLEIVHKAWAQKWLMEVNRAII